MSNNERATKTTKTFYKPGIFGDGWNSIPMPILWKGWHRISIIASVLNGRRREFYLSGGGEIEREG